MPSRAVTSFLLLLILHFRWLTLLRVNALSGCYLISTHEAGDNWRDLKRSVNALSGCYLISTWERLVLPG